MAKKERPIIFGAGMVRALLDGRKTQTRRVIKPDIVGNMDIPRGQGDVDAGCPYIETENGMMSVKDLCHYGQPGDILWVRETWSEYDCLDGDADNYSVAVCYKASYSEFTYGSAEDQGAVIWFDSDRETFEVYKQKIEGYEVFGEKWNPPIYMPKKFARIWLEITDIRVERVQDISEEDAQAEGCVNDVRLISDEKAYYGFYAQERFELLWDSVNAKLGHPWESNPWVWVIKFRRR